jgi:hypothetical protein
LLTAAHPPAPLLVCPGGHTRQGFFPHRSGLTIPATGTGVGFLKGCRSEEKTPFFSGAAFSLVDGVLLGCNLPDGVCAFAFDAVPLVVEARAVDPLALWLLADDVKPPA